MVERARRLLTQANAHRTVGAAAIFISTAYLASRLIGLFRDWLLLHYLGVSANLSAYYAAFRLPELLFTLLVSGAFAVAFIPVLTKTLEADRSDEAWQITSTLINILVLATIAGGIVIIILADPLITLLTPGFDKHTHDITVQLTRIMSVTPIFFAISSILGSVQQAFNRFAVFAFASIFYNLGIITGIFLFVPHFGIYGAAWGVVIGVIAQAILQVAGMYGLGFKYEPIFMIKLAGVHQTFKLMLPRSIDQGMDQINYLVETLIGSTVSVVAISQLSVANNLRNVPLVLIGSSITTAVFPRLAKAALAHPARLVQAYVQTARLILFLAIPSALLAFVARGYIVRLIYSQGDTTMASTLGAFAGSIIFTSLFMLVSRVYYAMQDTKTPLYVSLASIPLNIVLSFALSKQYGVIGLALSASIIAVLETLMLIVLLRVYKGPFGERNIISGALQMLVAGTIMAGTVYILINSYIPLYAHSHGSVALLPKFCLILVVAAITYLVPCYLMRITEAKQFIGWVRDTIIRTIALT